MQSPPRNGRALFDSQLTSVGWAGIAFGLIAGLFYSLYSKPDGGRKLTPHPRTPDSASADRQALIQIERKDSAVELGELEAAPLRGERS